MIIIPIIMYSALIGLQLIQTQQTKLKSLDNRAKKIVGGNAKMRHLENLNENKDMYFCQTMLGWKYV